MNVRHLMQPEVITLEATDTLDLADDIIRLARIRHLPVVADGEVVGILSQRDLFRAALSSVLHLDRHTEQAWLGRVHVASVMTRAVEVTTPDEPIRAAVERMVARRIGCLPVLEHGKLVGLLSETDCLRHLVAVLAAAEARDGLPELPASS